MVETTRVLSGNLGGTRGTRERGNCGAKRWRTWKKSDADPRLELLHSGEQVTALAIAHPVFAPPPYPYRSRCFGGRSVWVSALPAFDGVWVGGGELLVDVRLRVYHGVKLCLSHEFFCHCLGFLSASRRSVGSVLGASVCQRTQ